MKSADKAFRQHGQRSGYAVASAVMNEHLIRTKRRRVWGAKLWYSPFLPGAGPTVAPVKVYAPDGTLKEVVSAEDWRRRHGNPFTQPEEDEGDATTLRNALRNRDHEEGEKGAARLRQGI